MIASHDVQSLPTFTALGGHAVLDGDRMGTSIQLEETYFTGQLRALQALDGIGKTTSNLTREQRAQDLRESRSAYESIDVGLDSLTEQDLWNSSTRFRRQLQRIPEVEHLQRAFPGRCFVVPEWLQTGNRLHYGARVYFFRTGASPAPKDVMQKNIDAIVDGPFKTFERYQGELHGYPDCCIDFYHERSPDSPSPEWRSVGPFADRVTDAALGGDVSASIDDILPQFPENSYAFFAREFFPEPGCETAQTTGRTIYDGLSSAVDDQLVEDYFKILFGFNYLVARVVHSGADRRPRPGELGREHLLFYLPLGELATLPRYA